MSTTKKRISKKLIWVLVIAVIITAIIPLSSMGSGGAEVNVSFLVDQEKYSEATMPINEDTAEESGSTYFDKTKYPDDPEKEGYVFVGWTDGEKTYTKESDEQFQVTIGTDVVLNAVFDEQKADKEDETNSTSSDTAINNNSNNAKKSSSSNGTSGAIEESTVAKVIFMKTATDSKAYYETTIEKETMLDNWPQDPDDKVDGKAFLYWYDVNAAKKANGVTTPFSSKTIITSDTVLQAKYEDGHIVTFHDTDDTVLDTVAVESGSTVQQTKKGVDLNAGESVAYWYEEGNKNKAYDFNDKVSSNMDLYPKVTKNAVVYFKTDGSYIEPQVVVKGKTAKMPSVPDRAGYIFKGWSHTHDTYNEFKFDEEIITEDTTTVYAYWDIDDTTFTVNLWNEKANIKDDPGSPAYTNNYEMVGSTRVVASSGALVMYTTEKGIDGTIKYDPVKLYESIGGEVAKTLYYSDFFYSESKGVSGNGTTVINIYFKRTPFKFTFHPKEDTSTKVVDSSAKVVIGGNKYDEKEITLKVGQNMQNIWPSEVEATKAFTNWNKYASNASTEVYTALSATHINFFSQQTSPSDGDYTKVTKYKKPTKTSFDMYAAYLASLGSIEQRWYYTEDLDQTSTEVSNTRAKINDKYYTLKQKGVFTNQGTNLSKYVPDKLKGTDLSDWSGIAINGFKQVKKSDTGDTSYLNTNRKLYKASPNFIFPGGLTESEYQKYDNFGTQKDLLYIFKYFMERESYTFKLDMNGGTLSEDDTQGFTADKNGDLSRKYKFEEGIKTVGNPTKANYIFKGWYTDSVIQNDSTLAFGEAGNISKMPASDITLYAKFVGASAKIVYQDGSKELYAQDTNLYEFVTPEIPGKEVDGINYADLRIGDKVEGKGIFKGWFYRPGKDSELVEFQFEEFKVEKTQYDVYAKWTPVDYTVTYINDTDGKNVEVAKTIIKSTKNTLAKSQKKIEKLPIEKGYTFTWNTEADGSGKIFTEATQIKGDMNIYLIRTKDEENPVTSDATPGAIGDNGGNNDDFNVGVDPDPDNALAGPDTSNPSNTGSGGSGTALDNGSVLGSGASPSEIIANGLVPSANIGDKEVPLYSNGLFDSWALLNLILCIGGGLLAIFTVIRAFFRRNREDERLEANDSDGKAKKTRGLWLIATALFAIGGIVIFLLTEDTTTTMALVDNWTIANAFLFAASLISSIFVFKKEKKEDAGNTVAMS